MNTNQPKIDRACAAANKMMREAKRLLPQDLYFECRNPGEASFNSQWEIKAHGSDEVLGLLRLEREGKNWYNYTPNKYVLDSYRIKASYGMGSRRYKKVESLIKGIEEFCKPTTDHEAALAEVDARLRYAVGVRDNGRYRSAAGNQLHTHRTKPWVQRGPGLDSTLRLLASDSPSDRAKGQIEMIEHVKRQRMYDRWARRMSAITDQLWAKKIELEKKIGK